MCPELTRQLLPWDTKALQAAAPPEEGTETSAALIKAGDADAEAPATPTPQRSPQSAKRASG